MTSHLNSEIDKIILNNFTNTNLGSIVFALLSKKQNENFFAEIHGYDDYEHMKSVFRKTLYKKKNFPFLYPNDRYLCLEKLQGSLQKNLINIYKKYILLIIKNLNHDGFIDIDSWESLTEKEIYDLLSLNYNEFEKSLSVPELSIVDTLNFISNKNNYLNNREKELLNIANKYSVNSIDDIKKLLKRNVYGIFDDNQSFKSLLENSILIKGYYKIETENDLEHFFQKQKEFIKSYFQEITFFSQYFKEVILQKQKLFQEINMQHNHLKVHVLDFRNISINQFKHIFNGIPWHHFSQGRALANSYFLIFNSEQKEEIMVPGFYQNLKAYILP